MSKSQTNRWEPQKYQVCPVCQVFQVLMLILGTFTKPFSTTEYNDFCFVVSKQPF